MLELKKYENPAAIRTQVSVPLVILIWQMDHQYQTEESEPSLITDRPTWQ